MRATPLSLCLAACVVSACGGGSKGSSGPPTSPTVDTTSVTVSLRDVVLMGTTALATASATMSNGQTQAVTATWRSDATAVATVVSSGVVSGVANGEATIVAAFGGREGTKRIRVAPNYDGRWRGSQVITACAATGDFVGVCEDEGGFIGRSFPVGLTARHPGDLSVSGEFWIERENQVFPTFTAPVQPDGAISFSGSLTLEGIPNEASWQMNSTENGRAAGTLRERFTAPGLLSGDVTMESRLTDFNRSTAAAASAELVSGSISTMRSRIRALLKR